MQFDVLNGSKLTEDSKTLATASLRKERVQRNTEDQMHHAKEELVFLSDKKYLKFLARLPSFGGKSTKILIQKPESDRGEEDRRSLKLSPMSSNNVVQNTAMTLSKRRVRLNFEKYDCPLYGVQFIKRTNLPLKIVSSEAGSNEDSF